MLTHTLLTFPVEVRLGVGPNHPQDRLGVLCGRREKCWGGAVQYNAVYSEASV